MYNSNRENRRNIIKKKLNNSSILLIFLLLVLIPTSFSKSNYNYAESLELDYSISISYNLYENKDFKLEELDLFFYLFPQESDILEISKFPKSNDLSIRKKKEKDNDILEITPKSNQYSKGNIQLSTEFTNKENFPEISEKVNFPLENVPEEYKKYLEFNGLIDTSDEIKKKANELANGNDDLFVVATKIAQWIKNDIDYDLSTVALNPNQKSSEVFLSKKGVCKEITNLFVSMMRELGIPARVVTGYAYTNSQEVVSYVGKNWGGHAWAEVLIGDKWVPFDLTYDQYGYVDATHIPTYKDLEVKQESVSIKALGTGFNLRDDSINFDYNFKVSNENSLKEKGNRDISFEINGPKELGFNSYGYVEVNLKNNEEYYLVQFFQMAEIEGIEFLDDLNRMVLLKPRESKIILFRYKLPEFQSGFIYTLPFSLYQSNEEVASYKVRVSEESLALQKNLLPKIEEENKTLSNKDLEINCFSRIKTQFNEVFCDVGNSNNYIIKNIEICLDKSCKNLDLLINEKKRINFITKKTSFNISLKYNDKLKIKNFKIEKPELNIKYSINKQYLTLNLSKKNINKNDKLILSINNKIKKEINNNSYQLYLNEGDYNASIQIFREGNLIYKKEIKFHVEKYSFFQKILDFLSYFFSIND